MSIGSLFGKIWTKLMQYWSKIPQQTKDEIIEEILKQFAKIIREFFRNYKKQESSKR